MASVPSAALPGLERVPGKQNWIEKLPAAMRAEWHRSIIYRAAKHMAAKGMPVGMAIASANNWAEHICHTGDVKQWRGPQQVRPTSVAECCAARTLWGTMRAAAKADTSIPADERRKIDLTMRGIDQLAVELAFTEQLHPRVGKGKSGGGRFAQKGTVAGVESRARDQVTTNATGKQRDRHKHARDVLHRIAGIKRTTIGKGTVKERKQKTGLTTLARKWNRMPRAKRIAAMKAFRARQATLPAGWSFGADGTLHISLSVQAESIVDLAPTTMERRQARAKGQALPGKGDSPPRFPIRNRAELEKAIHAVGRARPNTEEERARVRRFVIRRARALGLSSLIPDNWQADGSLKS